MKENYLAYDDKHELTAASEEDIAAQVDSLGDILRERILGGEPIDDIIRELVVEERREIFKELLLKILSIIGDTPNAQLEIAALVEAGGLPLNGGRSQTEIAKSFGITRAAFSKRVLNVVQKLNMAPPRSCKREATHETYKTTNKRKIKI